jgi:hypothetical protein
MITIRPDACSLTIETTNVVTVALHPRQEVTRFLPLCLLLLLLLLLLGNSSHARMDLPFLLRIQTSEMVQATTTDAAVATN